jgi:hypothetical protein
MAGISGRGGVALRAAGACWFALVIRDPVACWTTLAIGIGCGAQARKEYESLLEGCKKGKENEQQQRLTVFSKRGFDASRLFMNRGS